VGGFGIKLDLK